MSYYNKMSASESEEFMRLEVLSALEGIVFAIWDNVTCAVFGSYATGLFLPDRYAR